MLKYTLHVEKGHKEVCSALKCIVSYSMLSIITETMSVLCFYFQFVLDLFTDLVTTSWGSTFVHVTVFELDLTSCWCRRILLSLSLISLYLPVRSVPLSFCLSHLLFLSSGLPASSSLPLCLRLEWWFRAYCEVSNPIQSQPESGGRWTVERGREGERERERWGGEKQKGLWVFS